MKDQPSLQSIIIIGLVGLLTIFSLNSFFIINPGEAGVLSILGKARDGVLLEGFHFKPPVIARVDVYDVTVQKFEVPAQSSTKDLQQLSASFAINFRLDPIEVVNIRRTQGTLQILSRRSLHPRPRSPLRWRLPAARSKRLLPSGMS